MSVVAKTAGTVARQPARPQRSAPPTRSTRRTQDERSRDTQQRVIAAALEMLSRKGYAGFRVNDVAKAAKVSRGAQTHHFPTKDSLVLAVLDHIFEDSTARSLRRIAELTPNDDLIEAMLKDAEAFFFSASFTVALDLLNLGTHGSTFHKRVKSVARDNRQRVEQAWGDALVASGVTATLAAELQLLSFSIMRGLAIRRLILDKSQLGNIDHMQESIALWRDLAATLIAKPIQQRGRKP